MRHEEGKLEVLFSNSLDLLFQQLLAMLEEEYTPTTRYTIVTPNQHLAAWVRMRLTILFPKGTLGFDFLTAPECFEEFFHTSLLPAPLVQVLAQSKSDRELERLFFEVVGVTQAGYKALWLSKEIERFSFQAKIFSHPFQVPKIASKLIFWGWSSLTEAYVKTLKLISRKVPVLAAFFSPCMLFWSDILSRKEEKSLLRRLERLNVSQPVRESLEAILATHEPFLANAGTLAKTFSKILDEEGIEGNEVYVLSQQALVESCYQEVLRSEVTVIDQQIPWTLLERVKTDMLLLASPMGVQRKDQEGNLFGGTAGFREVVCDGSLQVHAAHTPLQEVEALKEALYKLAHQESLAAGDVTLIVGDSDLYLDAVLQAFDGTPYQIVGMISRPLKELLHRLSYLFLLSRQKLSIDELSWLLDSPSFCRANGLDAYECKQFLKRVGFRWGLNSEHQKIYLQRAGFKPREETGSLKEVLAQASLFDEQAKNGLRLYSILNEIFLSTDVPQSMKSWGLHAEQILTTCFLEDSSLEVVLGAVRKVTSHNELPISGRLALFLLRKEIEKTVELRTQPIWAPIVIVPFQGPIPPVKYCLIVGVDSIYKRRDVAQSALESYSAPFFHPHYLIGQTMIELLFATKQAVLLSYKSYSFERREVVKPPAILRELLEALDSKYRIDGRLPSERLVYQHDMQQPYWKSDLCPQVIVKPLIRESECKQEVPSCSALLQFARHPLRRYLKQQCGVDFGVDWERKNSSEWIPSNSIRQSVRAAFNTSAKKDEVLAKFTQGLGKSGLLKELQQREIEALCDQFHEKLNILLNQDISCQAVCKSFITAQPYTLQFQEVLEAEKIEKHTLCLPQPISYSVGEGRGIPLVTGALEGVYKEGVIFYSQDIERELLQRFPELILRAVGNLSTIVISPYASEIRAIKIVNPLGLLEAWSSYFQQSAYTPYPLYPEVIDLLRREELPSQEAFIESVHSALGRFEMKLPIAVEKHLYAAIPPVEVVKNAVGVLYQL